METPSSQWSGKREVVSPFESASTTFSEEKAKNGRSKVWIVLIVLFAVIGAVGGVFVAKRLNDPLRTLEKFPVAKYLDNYHALAGARFRGELRVEADLGWRENVGRLMVFTLPEETRPIVVMIPAQFSGVYFSKGQTYLSELEVKEGGLIYANSCRKN